MELYPHQQNALARMHNGSILSGGTGVGKSITAVAYYLKHEAPKDVIVITTAKKRDSLDWEKEFVACSIYKTKETTVAGVLTVDSWNNIDKYRDVENAFFIFDEQRLVGAGAWTKAFIKIARQNHWILLSATPGDTWLDYIPVFIANGFYKNRTEFKREHVIYSTHTKWPKVERYNGVGKLVRHRNHILVDMPYERHTVRIEKDVLVDYDEQLFNRVVKDRWHVYENRPLRDVAELFSVMRKVAYTDPSRLTALRSLMRTHPRLVVFYNFNYELELLRTLSLTTTTPISSSSDYELEILRSLSTGSIAKTQDMSSSERTSRSSRISGEPTQRPAGTTSLGMSTSPKGTTGSSAPAATPPSTEASSPRESTSTTSTRTSSSASQKPEPQRSELKDPKTSSSSSSESSSTSSSSSGKKGTSEPTFAMAEWNGHKHEPIPTTDSWVYLVQYTAGSEGWNCTDTDAMVFYSLTYSYKNFHQAHGRIDRLNTPFRDLFYYVLKSRSAIDLAVAKSLKAKKNFNERDYAPV